MTRRKSTQSVQDDIGELYDDFKAKKVTREDADTLANIAGKWLKAQALIDAERVLEAHLARLAAGKATPLPKAVKGLVRKSIGSAVNI